MSCPSKTNASLRRSNFPLTHVRYCSLPRLGVGLAFADMHCDVRDCTLPTCQPLGDSRRSDARGMRPSNGRMALHCRVVSSASRRRLFCRRIHWRPCTHVYEGLTAKQNRVSVCLLTFDLCLTRCCLKQSSQKAQREQQNHRREVQSPNRGKYSSNRRDSRLGQLVHELHQWMTPVGPNP
jgi:hypothetical protein